MKLKKITKITGKIVLETGLHIGAGDTELRIGGTDNPVVKHPHTNEPYIPGSSIKGKVRSLLELKSGLMTHTNGEPLKASLLQTLDASEQTEAKKILQLFGASGADSDALAEIGPSRASFADAFLSEESKKIVKAKNQSYFEVKSENYINRIKGTAENPRFTERVVAGLKFDFTISLKEMEDDDNLLVILLQGLKLLELDALGGSGSRGYGRVRFEFNDEAIRQQFDQIELFA